MNYLITIPAAITALNAVAACWIWATRTITGRRGQR